MWMSRLGYGLPLIGGPGVLRTTEFGTSRTFNSIQRRARHLCDNLPVDYVDEQAWTMDYNQLVALEF